MLNSLRHWLIRLLGGEASALVTQPELPEHHTADALHLGVADAVDAALHDTHLVPYDENLLERARTQWQFGDWNSLAQLDRDTLQHHPDRAKLALLAAAGRLQTGNNSEAKAYIRLAQDWGVSKKIVSQILIAGVHNSIACAASIGGQQQRALEHFDRAIMIGTPGSDRHLITQARINEQHRQLGLPTLMLAAASATPVFAKRPTFKVTTLAAHNLGDAWAGNIVTPRHHGILTYSNTQYIAFYVDTHTLRLVQRDLASDTLKTFDLPGEYNLRDIHNSISMGIDRNGHLHISYSHHATQLRYRRSINQGDIGAWTEELPMTAAAEETVMCAIFILPRHGFPLTLLYCDGMHDKGTARIKTYDEATQTWSNHPQPILSGSGQVPWASNAYWSHPAVGTDGSLHLSFVWHTYNSGEKQHINNINIGYACSYDNGLTWQTSRKHPYKLPITLVNAETIHSLSPSSNFFNQTSMALDSHNRPHIAFCASDSDGILQYQHLWFDGKVWHHQIFSSRTETFSQQGDDMLQIPISRPEIVIDRQDNVFIITRSDYTGNRMAATCLLAPDYRYLPDSIQILCNQDLGFAEPIIDRSRWQQVNVLTLLFQKNQQPSGGVDLQSFQKSVNILDVNLIFN